MFIFTILGPLGGGLSRGEYLDDPRSTPMRLKLYLTFPQTKLQLFISKCSKLGLFFMTKCIFSLFLFWVIFTHHHPHIKNQFLKKIAYRWFTPTLFCTPWVIPKHVLRVPTMGILYFLLGGIQWCVFYLMAIGSWFHIYGWKRAFLSFYARYRAKKSYCPF